MACCSCDEHDYCCRCYAEQERAQRIIEDILDGTYDGEVEIPDFPHMLSADAHHAARAIVSVLKHERVV